MLNFCGKYKCVNVKVLSIMVLLSPNANFAEFKIYGSSLREIVPPASPGDGARRVLLRQVNDVGVCVYGARSLSMRRIRTIRMPCYCASFVYIRVYAMTLRVHLHDPSNYIFSLSLNSQRKVPWPCSILLAAQLLPCWNFLQRVRFTLYFT